MPHSRALHDPAPPDQRVDERARLRRLSDFEAAVARILAYMLAHRLKVPALLAIGGTCVGLFVGVAGALGFDHDGPTQKIARVERSSRQSDSVIWAELTKQAGRIDHVEQTTAAMGRTLDTVDVRTSRMEFISCVISRRLAPDVSAPGCPPIPLRVTR